MERVFAVIGPSDGHTGDARLDRDGRDNHRIARCTPGHLVTTPESVARRNGVGRRCAGQVEIPQMKKTLSALAIAVLMLGASGTAKAQAPAFGQPYQVPAGYEAYGAGTLVAYGGYNYVIQGDGTMLVSSPSVTCNQQPATVSWYVTQPTGYYVYRHHGYHARWTTNCVSWNGWFVSPRHCHYR